MKTINLSIAIIMSVVLASCTKVQTSEQHDLQTENDTEVYSLEPEIDTMNLVIEEEPYIPVVVDPVMEKPTYASRSYSSSSYESESEGDYWEEKRKHSPNDNYLLGFDEDVDDVHDMELYIEDY